MARPQIRHLALFATDPEKLAKFYHDVFGMDIIHTGGTSWFVSDGHLTLALLQHRLEGAGAHGLNHFGFSVDDRGAIVERLASTGVREPRPRELNVPYAELRGVDPEGNWFDLSQHGYETAEYRPEPSGKK